MMRVVGFVVAAALGTVVVAKVAGQANAQTLQPAGRVTDGAELAQNGEVRRPLRYRDWTFLSSGLGMTYGPQQPAPGRPPLFDNVFVNPQSHRAFLETGRWPDGTMLVLELRRSVQSASIDIAGSTQAEVVAVEAAVKDSTRYADTGGWKYFDFGPPAKAVTSSAPQPPTARCYACHTEHAAVENTFVQFYPTLFDVAKERGTVKATFDPNRKVR